jgi:basic amino acid/polyamine antiporter, APA family
MSARPESITAWGGLALVAGSMLGIGIFLIPPQVAGWLPTPTGYMLAWIVGGLIALTGASVYAELGQRCPQSGGDYVFISRAFGPSLAFAAGWVLFAGVFAGSVAALAVPIFQFQIPQLFPGWIGRELGLSVAPFRDFRLEGAQVAGIALVWFFTGLNMLGTRMAVRAQFFFTMIPVVVLGVLALVALLLFNGHDSASPSGSPTLEPPRLIGFGRALVAVYFAYAGWNAVAYLSGELTHPGPVLRRGLLGGVLLITGLYLLIAGGLFHLLGPGQLAQSGDAGFHAAQVVGGERGGRVMIVLVILAILGSLNATIMAGARVGWAMLRAGVLPGAARPHDDLRSTRDVRYPLGVQAGFASLLITTGTFEALVEWTGLAMILMSVLSTLSLFRLRRGGGIGAGELSYGGTPTLPKAPAALFFAMLAITAGMWLWGLAVESHDRGVSSFTPVGGLFVFVLLWGLHALRTSRA